MKLLFTALIIVGVLSGIYHGAQAGYGWFQMAGVVDDAAASELPGIVDRIQQAGTGVYERADRYAKVRDAIMKGAVEHGVPLRSEDVAVGIVDNMLDVRLSWEAPIVRYSETLHLEIPMSIQRRFSLHKRTGY